MNQVFPHGAVKVLNPEDQSTFKVNGHRLKPYFELDHKDLEVVHLIDATYEED